MAVAVADEVLAMDTGSVDGHVLKGLARFDAGNMEQAVQEFTRALETTPDDHGALLHRGIVLLQLGRNQDAAMDLECALKNHPDCDEAFYHLAIAYVHLGNRDAAIDALQTAIDIDPPRRAEAKKAAEFETLRTEPRFKAVIGGKRGRNRRS